MIQIELKNQIPKSVECQIEKLIKIQKLMDIYKNQLSITITRFHKQGRSYGKILRGKSKF